MVEVALVGLEQVVRVSSALVGKDRTVVVELVLGTAARGSEGVVCSLAIKEPLMASEHLLLTLAERRIRTAGMLLGPPLER